MTVRRASIVAAITAAVSIPSGAALASPGSPSQSASCVGSITSYETQNNPFTGEPMHGFVGPWIARNATSGPGTVADFNRSVAKYHGSVGDCV